MSNNSAAQSQKALSAYFTSKQILHFSFAEQDSISSFILRFASINYLII